ncbi:hypothetical protein CORC01_06464 [Colletotrichum orchidophilum]|uniref:Secreted protein n=1 Tax=Colletotrichum orchidophilum TaxID=1209926 RepID=A0A1G4BA32_9PEZI|nr:uncharacterized protein CORC01_06464 [Colletotrichum orchidophilum]OHE98267.1 hypothetical protein CORC01_06464 [Colletotrichum orchidophilum]
MLGFFCAMPSVFGLVNSAAVFEFYISENQPADTQCARLDGFSACISSSYSSLAYKLVLFSINMAPVGLLSRWRSLYICKPSSVDLVQRFVSPISQEHNAADFHTSSRISSDSSGVLNRRRLGWCSAQLTILRRHCSLL